MGDQLPKEGQHLPGPSGTSASALRSQPGRAVPPELDFLSPHFDAKKALYTPGLAPPIKVKPLDNLARARYILPADMPESLAPRIGNRTQRSAESIAAQERAKARSVNVQHRMLQMEGRQNHLQEVMDMVKPESPLAMLKPLAERQARLRVVTRHACGVRGVAIGFLLAFDKYMNLLMKDVDEDYTVKVKVSRTKIDTRPREAPGKGGSEAVDAVTGQVQRLRVRWRPKLEVRKRHLKQILIRGDSIVMVSPA